MKLQKEVLLILYVFMFLLNDPQISRVATLWTQYTRTDDFAMDMTDGSFEGADDASLYLAYAVNGGRNSRNNPSVISREDLPFILDVPVREGYNFAGWYTDNSYSDKITEINQDNAANMVLFAKWTREIDNHYNVEMYAYNSNGIGQKKLRECRYDFLDTIKIPGNPSTRESDYMGNRINSENQYLQGLCFTPELILMTSYAEGNTDMGSLLVFDRKTGKYLVTLGMKEESHLGGIAYDGENIWICHSDSNSLERIPYAYILKIAGDAPGYCIDASALSDEYRLKNRPSSITYYGGRIWVATHTKVFGSEMVSYSYDTEEDKLTSLSSYNLPSKVQGIAFDKHGAVYLSTSYGRNNSSYLKAYSSLLALDQRPNHPSVKVEMPPCSEGIVTAENNVYVLFESAGRKYFEGTDGNGRTHAPIDQVLEVSVASIW